MLLSAAYLIYTMLLSAVYLIYTMFQKLILFPYNIMKPIIGPFPPYSQPLSIPEHFFWKRNYNF
jgi:hypothetical protein